MGKGRGIRIVEGMVIRVKRAGGLWGLKGERLCGLKGEVQGSRRGMIIRIKGRERLWASKGNDKVGQRERWLRDLEREGLYR